MRYGRKTARWAWTVAAASLLGLSAPAGVEAQDRFSFFGQGGVAIGVSDLADLTDPGPSLGGGIAYWVTPRVAIRGDFDANLLSGRDAEGPGPEGPDIDLFHYSAGVQFALTDRRRSPWNLMVNVAGGGTTIDADPFDANGAVVDFTETYFTLNGGLSIGYDVSRSLEVFLEGQWYLAFTDDDETAVFHAVTPEVDVTGFDTASVIPVTLGVRIRTN